MRSRPIEIEIRNYLAGQLDDIPVNVQKPDGPPDLYVLIEKVGSFRNHGLWTDSFAVQSCGKNILEVMNLNQEIKTVLPGIVELDDFFRCECETDYNFTNTETKEYRYQAVFEIVYKGV